MGKILLEIHSSFITEILTGVALLELHFNMDDSGIEYLLSKDNKRKNYA
jgi:hypothetical protein